MTHPKDLSRMVPGFEFLQTLIKGASAGLPGVQGFGQWVAPTLDPEELDKRIQELKTVQFWLEQNARLLAGTVQALEVQRMTLNTLQSMNLPLTELREALQARPSAAPAAPVPEPAPAPYWVRPPQATAPPAAEPPPPAPAAEAAPAASAAPAAAPAPAIDPMQWWGALTRQFTEIAAQALQEGSAEAASRLAAAAPSGVPETETAKAAPRASKPRAQRGAAAAPAPKTRRPAQTAGSAKPAGRKAAASAPAAGKARAPRPRKA